MLANLAAMGSIPPELAPLWHWRRELLAQARNDTAAARQAAETMTASLATRGPDAVLAHQIMARYDLARFWSGLGDRARGFAEWTAGHALRRRVRAFSRKAHRALVEASIAAFTPASFAPATGALPPGPVPVFIVGMPRSGTTLCEPIIAAHPQAHGARIIRCVREPRDIGLSIFTFHFYGSHGDAHDLADLGWTIAQHDRLMAHWRTVLPNPVLTVKLSDWVEDFDTTLARVLGHLSPLPDPACARFHEADSRVRTVSRSQLRQPVNAKGLGRWQGHAAEPAPLIAELDAAGSLASWPVQPTPKVIA